MAFQLERLFVDVFAPQSGDVVTIMYDLPHGSIQDNEAWRERRQMANDWHQGISDFSQSYGILVNPMVTYEATGSHHASLPIHGRCAEQQIVLEEIVKSATVIISMPQYSATGPLIGFANKYEYLRVASMPMVARSMEATGLSADYQQIAAACERLVPLFEGADGIEVTFSTGHTCYFDTSDQKLAFVDNGLLHPGTRKGGPIFANLPAGEVATCPNEAENSLTAGRIPVAIGDEMIVFVVKHNQIVEIEGNGPTAEEKRQAFQQEVALRNIAEVAIGCNDQAVVTGNVLEDEKAGFHWAYGRSDFLGGKIGVEDFSSPDKVCHIDTVYAKGNPIVCERFDFIFPDGARKTAITNGVLCV